jgi:RND family efflux transporter MFP subunit
VGEGDQVKEGQIIAELESADAQALLAQVRADIAAARAKVERARADLADADIKLTREQVLLDKAAGTLAAADDARARQKTAKAQLEAADADVKAVEARLTAAQVAYENTRVRAPFSGTVIRKLAEIGEIMSPGMTGAPGSTGGIFTLASLDDLEVQADVGEAQIGRVQVGTPAEILLDAFAQKRFRGQVSEIRQMVERAKATVTVKVRFTDSSQGVLPDMAAKVSFLEKPIDDQALTAAPKLIVASDAVVERGGAKVVLTLDDGHIHEVPVSVGDKAGSMIELVKGPVSGTKVVRHPGSELHEGIPVKERKK